MEGCVNTNCNDEEKGNLNVKRTNSQLVSAIMAIESKPRTYETEKLLEDLGLNLPLGRSKSGK